MESCSASTEACSALIAANQQCVTIIETITIHCTSNRYAIPVTGDAVRLFLWSVNVRNLFLLALLLSACSTTNPARVALVGNGPDDMCHPADAVTWTFYPVSFPICVIHDAENQCGPQGCGGTPQHGAYPSSYMITGPGTDFSMVYVNR